MKIIHICLCGPYNDGWSYQENLIPKYNRLDNHEVTVIANRFINNKDNKGLDIVDTGEYMYESIKVIRIDKPLFIPNTINSKIRIYSGLYGQIEKEKPDLIFFHGIQSIEMLTVKKYIKKNPKCKWVVDNHASKFNSGAGFFSKLILHKIIYKGINNLSRKYITNFFSVTPECKIFMIDMYDIPKEKINNLYLGYDTNMIEEIEKKYSKKELRVENNFNSKSIIFITGGKLDLDKRILETMKLFSEIKNEDTILLIFGEISNEIKEKFDKILLNNKDKISYVGWKNQQEINKLLLLSDVGIFIGSQSALWQQCMGAGLPLILSKQENVDYLDFGGNVLFVDRENYKEMKSKIENLLLDPDIIANMAEINEEYAKGTFSYRDISRKAILEDENK